jgi:signal transduction histidine kinase
MTPQKPAQTLEAFQTQAFARHVLFDLPFPIMGTVLVVALIGWLMHGRVSNTVLVAWVLFAAVTLLTRALFERRMKTRVAQGDGHAQTLRGMALLAIPTGAISGAFAWMYFDAQQPLTMVILGTYMAVTIVGAVVPSSVHLPIFYSLVLPAHLPYLLSLVLAGGTENWAVAGINVLFLMVVFNYAHAANQMQRDAVRLRYENQNLIDDLEQRKADAENASRTKSLFLAGVSHDLKQPIRAIGLYTGFLRHSAAQNDTPPPVVAQTAGKIESAASAIHGQITRLLELSRLESGAMPLNLEPLDLDDVFTPVRELMASEAHAHGVQLRFALGHQRQLLADWRMLESILVNFVSNAIKHAEGGRVYVGTRWRTSYPQGQQLCIEVRDNGSGIAAHQLPLLFDAYRSFDDRTASESHGLGLAIAKAQATYLGCDIAVNSAPGRGSTFTLCGLRTASPSIDTPSDTHPVNP